MKKIKYFTMGPKNEHVHVAQFTADLASFYSMASSNYSHDDPITVVKRYNKTWLQQKDTLYNLDHVTKIVYES